MKRMLSLLVVLCLVLSVASPVFAVEATTVDDSRLTREELMELACEAFPEYATKITTFPESAARSRSTVGAPSVVRTETKQISANETITYAEFSSGVTNIIYNKAWYEHSSTQSGTITTVTGDLSCMCNLSLEELYIADFVYCINSSGNDYISSYGTDALSDCDITAVYKKMYENSSSNAYLEYRVLFAPYPYLEELGYASHSAIIRLEVGDNAFTHTVNGS